MRYKDNVFHRYLSNAPLPLALERLMECRIYLSRNLVRPILDLGVRRGLFARMLFAEKVDTGIDPDPAEIERARASEAYSELIQCGGDSIPKPDGYYNTIFSNSVLEHIPNLEPVFREANRVLAIGGRFYFTVPSDWFEQYTGINKLLCGMHMTGVAAKYRSFFNRFWKHYHYYSIEKWESVAKQAGFVVVESFSYDPEFLCLLNDLLVPFALPSFLAKKFLNRWVFFPGFRSRSCAQFQNLRKWSLKREAEPKMAVWFSLS